MSSGNNIYFRDNPNLGDGKVIVIQLMIKSVLYFRDNPNLGDGKEVDYTVPIHLQHFRDNPNLGDGKQFTFAIASLSTDFRDNPNLGDGNIEQGFCFFFKLFISEITPN